MPGARDWNGWFREIKYSEARKSSEVVVMWNDEKESAEMRSAKLGVVTLTGSGFFNRGHWVGEQGGGKGGVCIVVHNAKYEFEVRKIIKRCLTHDIQ